MTANRFRLAVAAIVIGALGACTAHPSDNAALVCEARARVGVSLTVFLSLDPATAQAGDYAYAWSAVREDYIDLQDYQDNMQFENASALDDAMDDLEGAVDDIPADANMAEAVASIQPEIEAAQAALAAVDDDIDCPV